MINIKGELFNGIGNVDAICITTNGAVRRDGACVMGRGCAKQAVSLFPGINFELGSLIKQYGNRCMIIRKEKGTDIVSFVVKKYWNLPAELDIIEKSCKEIVQMSDKYKWQRVLIPRPGCGNGQLKYEDVEPILQKYLDDRFFIVTH